MSAAPALRRHSRRRSATVSVRFLAVNAVLLDALFLVGAIAVWPLYRDSAFLVVVAAALVLAHLIALAGMRWRWSGWWVALATMGTYIVSGVPLAAPSALSRMETVLPAFLGVLTAPVTGWKDLLTLELPLGSYQTTLAPALLLFLAIPVAALSLAWRSPRLWVVAAPLGLLLTVFGVLFGAATLSSPVVGGVRAPGAVELFVGAAAVLLALAFTVWRTLHERRRALRAAERASGVRTTGRTGSAVAGRVTIAAGMVLAALAAGAAVAPWALAGQSRDVLRSGIDPRVELAAQLSPLSQYRQFFSDEQFDTVLFTVDGAAGADRVRLATLSFFDGQVARAIDPAAGVADQTTAFVRVPANLPAPDGTTATTADVSIGAYEGIWVPTVGSLTAISFEGGSGADRSDGFFYNAETRMGIALPEPGLRPGATYRQQGAIEDEPRSLTQLTPGRDTPQLDAALVPESLTDWIGAQEAPTGGEGLQVLIDRLRARGFLSHALLIDAEDPALWTTQLGAYTFEPSRAGHSTDRIDRLFTALLDRQEDVGGTDDAALVAAVGDDEQFAVAASMIADQLGFASRIVLGARLVDGGDPAALPACVSGECRGENMSAWIEVQDASGAWVSVDVTPQHEVSMSPELEQRRDPQNPTDVRQEVAEPVLPAEANPADSGDRDDDDTTTEADLSALWAALRIAGITLLTLLVLVGPFLLVVLLKTLRRRARRDADDVVERFTGGWDEYVDTAVDHGYPTPRTQTRTELAAGYAGEAGGDRGTMLAEWADRSVFAPTAPSADDSERFWQIVDEERARFAAEGGWWARLRARLSLRSFLRSTRTRGRQWASSRRGRERR
ncbi:transglutaminase-like domain-containing protein [Microbacterium sp. zg-YB36]|uniref:transglutaminase-like domain-containing protein n=1 Tax=Microbacterium sp. zg-YB36 TaxID=2969407 RepID=UPI00214CF86F|nr:transglutaminase-like domain-containing protein [Microbacterium sp. zg-YB36]MDL5350821.1 transglutaminase-like domain-containing protein [Microbacterium sp. zg-YB36]